MDTIEDVLKWLQQTRTAKNEAVVTLALGNLRDAILLELPPVRHPRWMELQEEIEARENQILKDTQALSYLRLWSYLLKSLVWRAQQDHEGLIEDLELALDVADATTRAKSLHDIYDRILEILKRDLRLAKLAQ